MSEGELDELMGEVGGPCNVMGMVNMFQERWLPTAPTPTSSSFRPSWPTTRACTLIYSAFENNKSTSTQTWPDRGESEEVTRKMKEISPARTCLHPMRTPSRMDQLEDLLTPLLLGNFLSRPLSKLCRFKCPSSVQALPGWCVPAVRWTSPPGPPPSPA